MRLNRRFDMSPDQAPREDQSGTRERLLEAGERRVVQPDGFAGNGVHPDETEVDTASTAHDVGGGKRSDEVVVKKRRNPDAGPSFQPRHRDPRVGGPRQREAGQEDRQGASSRHRVSPFFRAPRTVRR